MGRIDGSRAQAVLRGRRQPWNVALFSLIAGLTAGGCLPDSDRTPAGGLSPEPTATTASVAGSPSSVGPMTTSAVSSPPAAVVPSSTAGQGGEPGWAVRSVTDGDTLVLEDGRRVRLAQVDAPETGACFGSPSTQALRGLVEGRIVTVRRPENGPERDRYGRTLGEVSVAGRSVNEELVRSGAAGWYEEFAHEDAGLAARLRAAEDEAKRANVDVGVAGRWRMTLMPTLGSASRCLYGTGSRPRRSLL